jgi:outer membrane protein W
MKTMKYYGFFFLLIAFLISTNAEASYFSGMEVEAKISAFFPSSKKVRRLYSKSMPYYELEISKKFCNNWQVGLSGGYVSKRGHAIGCRNRTCFRLIPLSLGLKYLYPFNPCINLYVGAGISWSFFKNKDHSPFVHETNNCDAVGGLFKIGFTYAVKECIFIDIFTEYLHQKFSFSRHYKQHYTVRHHLNMSGFTFGGGLGFNF